jgi:haloacid dehalogenase-like hydrolase
VASWKPQQDAVLEAINDLGLELQIVFNKGAVMVLPAGINKASGLLTALRELALSPINAVAIGDGENDHALLKACGCAVVPAQMLPLARGECGPDPQDDIKGQALDILWPNYISATELFALITHPNEGYYGAYALFLNALPKTLTGGDLLPALEWATGFIAQVTHNGTFKEKTLADAILFRAWKVFEEPPLTRPFVEHVFARLREHGDLCRGTDYRARDAFLKELKDDVARRRKFLLAACTYPIERMAVFSYLRAGILMHAGLEWLLETSPGGTAPVEGLNSNTLCNLIEIAFDYDNPVHFEALYAAALRWSLLWARYATVFEGVSLDSAEVAQARDRQRQLREMQEDIPPPLVADPTKQVLARLEQFEAGQPDDWWRLNMDLTLTPTSRQPGSDLDYVITEMPGGKMPMRPSGSESLPQQSVFSPLVTPPSVSGLARCQRRCFGTTLLPFVHSYY